MRALRSSHAASSSAEKALASEIIGRRWVTLASALDERRPDALGGTVGRAQLGVLGLERLQLAKQPVVLGVRDLGRVENVVGVVGPVDLLAQPERLARLRCRSPRGGLLAQDRLRHTHQPLDLGGRAVGQARRRRPTAPDSWPAAGA